MEPERIVTILDILTELYPDARCSLDYRNPLELLVATILSAQCTDERVNKVTPALFAKYPAAEDYAQAPLEELEEMVQSTGFYRNKAKNIRECCRILAEHHGGIPPANLDELVKLPGVGRKTANVVLGDAYGIPGIVVDTHVGRIAGRLGFTAHTDPEKIEQDLMVAVPKERWTLFCHQVIMLGRSLCKARKPDCPACPLRPHCNYGRSV